MTNKIVEVCQIKLPGRMALVILTKGYRKELELKLKIKTTRELSVLNHPNRWKGILERMNSVSED